jgi:hypothetical protein
MIHFPVRYVSHNQRVASGSLWESNDWLDVIIEKNGGLAGKIIGEKPWGDFPKTMGDTRIPKKWMVY